MHPQMNGGDDSDVGSSCYNTLHCCEFHIQQIKICTHR